MNGYEHICDLVLFEKNGREPKICTLLSARIARRC